MRALVEVEGVLLENKYGQIIYLTCPVQRWKVESDWTITKRKTDKRYFCTILVRWRALGLRLTMLTP